MPADQAHLPPRDKPILVTGAAGFIGFHLARRLLDAGYAVVGFDAVTPYYDVGLKRARLALLAASPAFTFVEAALEDRAAVRALFEAHRPSHVAHLAAQAGVRHSLAHPEDFIGANLVGFFHVIEACREFGVENLVYASSSSVYGANLKQPFSVEDAVDHPISLYAATKKSNELIAHTYSHLYRLPTTGLRFFTVYGPWGRPDMAYFLFTKAIAAGEPINLFNNGDMVRDFTYIDDIVEGVVRTLGKPAEPDPDWNAADPDPATSSAPWRIYNIGHNHPEKLTDLIALIEEGLGRKARTVMLPMQPGDVPATYADIDALARDVGFRPSTSLREGVGRFLAWYKEHYGLV